MVFTYETDQPKPLGYAEEQKLIKAMSVEMARELAYEGIGRYLVLSEFPWLKQLQPHYFWRVDTVLAQKNNVTWLRLSDKTIAEPDADVIMVTEINWGNMDIKMGAGWLNHADLSSYAFFMANWRDRQYLGYHWHPYFAREH